MKTFRITYFENDTGEAPLVQWLSVLKDRKAAALIKVRIDRLSLGLFGDAKHLEEGVYELRIHFGPGYRLYFTKCRESTVVLLCGGDKSSQKSDLNRALSYCKILEEENYAKAS